MSAYSGPGQVNDGLVFQYDMGNPLKSWKGKPTTNYISNPTEEMARGEFGQYRDLAPIFDTYGLVPYSLSMDIKVNKPGNVYVYMQNGSSTKYGFVGANAAATTEYQRFYFNNLTPTISTPTDTVAMLATYTGYGSGVNPTVKNIQVELGSFATPFVAGTRSSTQALLDLANDNSLNVQELSYSSDGSFAFDGIGENDGSPTGSYIAFPTALTNTSTATYPNGCTYNFWLNVDTDANDRISLMWGAGSIQHIEIYSSSKYFRTEATTQNGYSFGSGVFPDSVRGTWSHFAIVFANAEATRPVRWYQNGKLFYTGNMEGGTGGANEYFQFSGLGRATGTSSYFYATSFKGKLPVFSIYEKALTSDEVMQNYLAIKARYDL